MQQLPGRLRVLTGVFLPLVMSLTAQPGAADDQLAQRLRKHVQVLAGEIGERNPSAYDNLEQAATYIQGQFEAIPYDVESQSYTVGGRVYRNLIASRPGRDKQEEQVVLGAHHDTVPGSPGADDNASGVSVLLELARLAIDREFGKTFKFVAFSTEEMPSFRTDAMGSHAYASRAKARGDRIVGMISLEMVGYYSDLEGSQSYPTGFSLFYPSRGNFISLVSDFWSWRWKNKAEAALKRSMRLPVESVATFRFVPGVDWSDHRSFWEAGYFALMMTDTAFYRNPHYHRGTDTPEKLDYSRMADLTRGLLGMLERLAP